MRQQYHFRQSAKGLLAWDVFRLIKLAENLPVIDVPLTSLTELDEAFWYELGGAKPTCRSVAGHAKMINDADLSYPILLCHKGRVMDGMHRVCKAQMSGMKLIKAKQFARQLEPDYTGIDADDLPYDQSRLRG